MKNLELNKIGTVAAGGAIVTLLISIVLFLVTEAGERDRYNFAFPDTAGGSIHHEWRVLPSRHSVRDRAELIVRELLLGPVALGAVPIVPEESDIRSVIYNENTRTVFIDFTPDVILQPGAERIPFEDAVALIDRNIRHNLKMVESIVVTIDGQIPGAPRFDTL